MTSFGLESRRTVLAAVLVAWNAHATATAQRPVDGDAVLTAMRNVRAA